MRKITERGLQLIKDFEGFSATLYRCPAGYQTIGYGHLVRSFEHDRFASISAHSGLSNREASAILREDVKAAERAVSRLIIVPLSHGQFDSLVDFTFNLGSGSLQSSTLRRVINRYDYDEAPHQLRRWVFAGGIKLRGLVRRRDADAVLFQMLDMFDN